MNNNELYEKFEELKEIIGTDALLDELFQALSTDDAYENLEYIDRMNDTRVF